MRNVLIIDDSAYNRKLVSKILASDPYQIHEAENGHQALQVISQFPPDCILLDLIMPEMSGFELIATLRQRGIQTPIIVITADIQRDTYEQCIATGADEVLTKPVDPDALRHTLAQTLSNQHT